jgi:hypothetical protein
LKPNPDSLNSKKERKNKYYSLWSIKTQKDSLLQPLSLATLEKLENLLKTKHFNEEDHQNYSALLQAYSFENFKKYIESEEDPSMTEFAVENIGSLYPRKSIPPLFQRSSPKRK